MEVKMENRNIHSNGWVYHYDKQGRLQYARFPSGFIGFSLFTLTASSYAIYQAIQQSILAVIGLGSLMVLASLFILVQSIRDFLSK